MTNYPSKYTHDLAIVALGLTMCAIAFLQYSYKPQNLNGIFFLLSFLGIILKVLVVIGSLFLLLRLRYPQSVVAGVILFCLWLLPEFFPDSLIGVFIKKVNDIFGYFGGLLIYPIWRWQSLSFSEEGKEQLSDSEHISLHLRD